MERSELFSPGDKQGDKSRSPSPEGIKPPLDMIRKAHRRKLPEEPDKETTEGPSPKKPKSEDPGGSEGKITPEISQDEGKGKSPDVSQGEDKGEEREKSPDTKRSPERHQMADEAEAVKYAKTLEDDMNNAIRDNPDNPEKYGEHIKEYGTYLTAQYEELYGAENVIGWKLAAKEIFKLKMRRLLNSPDFQKWKEWKGSASS